MSKRTITLAVAAIVIAVAAAPFVIAGERFHHRDHFSVAGESMMFSHIDRVKSALDLSDAQVAQLHAIRTTLFEQNKPYRDSLHGGFGAVAQALLANPNDLAGAQALMDKQDQAERMLKTNTLAAAAKAANVLTPAQREKVSQFITERQSRRPQRDAQ